MTVGGAMSGYCEIGRVAHASCPAMTMTIAMTPASTGRSMKNFENMSVGRGGRCFGGRRRGLCHDCRARIQLHQVVQNDGVADIQAFANDPVLTDPITDFDGALRGFAVAIDDPYVAAKVSLQDG